MDLLKVPTTPCKNKVHNKGHLNLAVKVPKSFSLGVFNRFFVIHSKNSSKRNLEPKSELIILILFKVAFKS